MNVIFIVDDVIIATVRKASKHMSNKKVKEFKCTRCSLNTVFIDTKELISTHTVYSTLDTDIFINIFVLVIMTPTLKGRNTRPRREITRVRWVDHYSVIWGLQI